MEGDLQRAFGRGLRRERKRLKLSQEKMAEHIGIHRTYVGLIERGERNLSLKVVERVAEALDADPLDMLRGPDPPTDQQTPPKSR